MNRSHLENRGFRRDQEFSPISCWYKYDDRRGCKQRDLDEVPGEEIRSTSQTGQARTHHLVDTMNDGQTIFSLVTGEVKVPVHVVGTLSADVLAEAVVRAIYGPATGGRIADHCERNRAKVTRIARLIMKLHIHFQYVNLMLNLPKSSRT